MAAFDLQEQEQIDALKALWRQWGWLIVTVAVVFVGGYLGNQGWNVWKRTQGATAAEGFAAVQTAYKAKDAAKTLASAQKLVAEHPTSPLAGRAYLLAAKIAFDGNDLPGAQKSLEWVVANVKEPFIVDVASLRLSAVLLDQKNFDAALAAVKSPKSQSTSALFADARGDVLALKGDAAAARTAYKEALERLEKDAPVRKMVEVKLSTLGV